MAMQGDKGVGLGLNPSPTAFYHWTLPKLQFSKTQFPHV